MAHWSDNDLSGSEREIIRKAKPVNVPQREQSSRQKRMVLIVRYTLVEILRRGSIVDTDDPYEIEAAMTEQNKIADRIAATVK